MESSFAAAFFHLQPASAALRRSEKPRLLAVEGGIPWVNDAARHAGTVHAVGTFEELRRGEDEVNAGRMPDRPLVLVGQQYLADPGRSAGDQARRGRQGQKRKNFKKSS